MLIHGDHTLGKVPVASPVWVWLRDQWDSDTSRKGYVFDLGNIRCCMAMPQTGRSGSPAAVTLCIYPLRWLEGTALVPGITTKIMHRLLRHVAGRVPVSCPARMHGGNMCRRVIPSNVTGTGKGRAGRSGTGVVRPKEGAKRLPCSLNESAGSPTKLC